MDKAEQVLDKIAKLHTETAGGTLAGGIAGGFLGRKMYRNFARDMHLYHNWKTYKEIPKTFKAGVMLPAIAGGALVGYGVGKGIDAIFKKGELEKEAQFFKALGTLVKTKGTKIVKGLGSHRKTMGTSIANRVKGTVVKGTTKFQAAKNAIRKKVDIATQKIEAASPVKTTGANAKATANVGKTTVQAKTPSTAVVKYQEPVRTLTGPVKGPGNIHSVIRSTANTTSKANQSYQEI